MSVRHIWMINDVFRKRRRLTEVWAPRPYGRVDKAIRKITEIRNPLGWVYLRVLKIKIKIKAK